MNQLVRKVEPEDELNRRERSIRSAIAAFVTRLRRLADRAVELVQRGNVEGVLRIADRHVEQLGTVLARVFEDAGIAEMERLSAALGDFTVAAAFDVTNTRAAEIMRNNKLTFIREFTRQQRQVTRTALIQAFNTGEGPRTIARMFRQSVGLTQYQLSIVESYRRALEEGNRSALTRALRDRRFDSTVSRAISGGAPLSASQIDTMVNRYQNAAVALRAETIARTEGLRVLSEARNEALRQLLEQTGINRSRVVRIWRSTRDGRTRDSHASLNGQERGVDELFVSPWSGASLMYPGDPRAPASETVNCRCTVVTEIRAP